MDVLLLEQRLVQTGHWTGPDLAVPAVLHQKVPEAAPHCLWLCCSWLCGNSFALLLLLCWSLLPDHKRSFICFYLEQLHNQLN